MGILSLPFIACPVLAITRLQAFSQPIVVLHQLQHDESQVGQFTNWSLILSIFLFIFKDKCRGKDCDCAVYVREKLDHLLIELMDTSKMTKTHWKNARTSLDSSVAVRLI